MLKLIPPFREQDERLLICATNSVRALDSAFLRHGRFDYVIPIGPPDPPARAAIWDRYLAAIPHGDLDMAAIVAESRLFTPADIEFAARRTSQLVFERVLFERGEEEVTTGDILHAIGQTRRTLTPELVAEFEQDIKDYAIYMDRGGQTGAEPALEPALRPRSASNPNGFDYEHTIHVLPGNTLTLDGGGTLEIAADYPPTEARHMATVYSKDLNALFLSDFGYNKVHLWMGDDIDLARVGAWRAELVKLKTRYAALDPRVYPGHGDPADMSLLDTMIRYIDDYRRIVSTAKSRDQAMQEMTALYPDYSQADFFLKYSIDNHMK